ncbi:MAG: DNA repair protein RecN [Clostridia bacterium]|nr:DNA repair protein RecN [Clostridia bacterium]
MIASLTVENIALIEQLVIEFGDGLNVMTGETGAGKSIIVDAMNLALGERAERSLIRHGADAARIEALIYPEPGRVDSVLEEHGLPVEEEILIERIFSANGRSRCRINGKTCTLSALKAVMDTQVDLHGQHEHQSLLYPAHHVRLLDEMSPGSGDVRVRIRAEHQKLRAEQQELERLGGDLKSRQDMMDFLAFQIDELEEAALRPGELEELSLEQERIERNADMDRDLHLSQLSLFEGTDEMPSVLGTLRASIDRLSDYVRYDAGLESVVEQMNDAYYTLEDTSGVLSRVMDNLSVDGERRAIVEERIDLIQSLLRKHRANSEDELLAILDDARRRYDELENADARHARLTASISDHRKVLWSLYKELSALRHDSAALLESQLLSELADLGMRNASFTVAFSGLEDPDSIHYGAESPESAEFMISVNPGEPLKPLSKVASGGEISRIMLGFKVLTADHDGIGTLIFDEVDTGISGRVAQIVAEKMASIAGKHQVITVTHLPQIAAAGDENFYIHKEVKGDRTNTYVEKLDEAGKRTEIARLTGGIESESAAAHAQELMDNARERKERQLH